jgi:hypothetical protein
MSRCPTLGRFADGHSALFDIERLLETRMLVQANSGGGKSYCIRRLLEQTAGKVQQLVVDPEGEFATLREKHDFIIAAPHDGDALAHPKTAKILAHRLLETGVSAILDIYDLKAHERQAFVRVFLDAIVNAPKALWRPALIVLDEAHVFAPEHGKAESAGAVIDLATRGRKRGFALVAATQRLAKLHKDVAAELLNKLIGRTGLDVDVKRAADELGMTAREAMEVLRPLAPGHFFAFGPALSDSVRELTIGQVETTHPKSGDRALRAPPKPTAAIKAVLPKLADLPKEAEQEARSLEDLRRELAQAKRELTQIRNAAPSKGPSLEDISIAESKGFDRGVQHVRREMHQELRSLNRLATPAHDHVEKALSHVANLIGALKASMEEQPKAPSPVAQAVFVGTLPRAAPKQGMRANGHAEPIGDLTPVQQRILNALAEAEQLSAEAPDRALVAILSGYSHIQSTGFVKALGGLSTAGLVTYPPGGRVALTDEGRAAAQMPESPTTAEELQRRVIDLVGGAAAKVLKPLIDANRQPMTRQELALASGYTHVQSTGFVKVLGKLRTLGFIDYGPGSTVTAQPVLFLEGT